MTNDDNQELTVRTFSNRGNFNFAAPSEYQYNIGILIRGHGVCKSVSQTFDDGYEPDIDMVPPSELVDVLEERINSYWLMTDRESKLSLLNKIRDHAGEIDSAWAAGEIEQRRKKLDNLSKQISILERYTENAILEELE